MNKAIRVLGVWAVAASLSAMAALASAVDRFDEHCCNVVILQSRAVQKDIGITAKTRARMNQHAAWFNERTKALRNKYRNASDTEANRKAYFQDLTHLNDQMRALVLSELSDKQLQRLRELSLQNAGYSALLDRVVCKRLGVSEASRKKLQNGYEKNSREGAKLERSVMEPIARKYQAMNPKTTAERKALTAKAKREIAAAKRLLAPKMKKLSNRFASLVAKTLTAKQRKDFAQLKGKPFKHAKK